MAAQARQGMHIALHVFEENPKLKPFLCYCNFLSYFVIFQVLTTSRDISIMQVVNVLYFGYYYGFMVIAALLVILMVLFFSRTQRRAVYHCINRRKRESYIDPTPPPLQRNWITG